MNTKCRRRSVSENTLERVTRLLSLPIYLVMKTYTLIRVANNYCKVSLSEAHRGRSKISGSVPTTAGGITGEKTLTQLIYSELVTIAVSDSNMSASATPLTDMRKLTNTNCPLETEKPPLLLKSVSLFVTKLTTRTKAISFSEQVDPVSLLR